MLLHYTILTDGNKPKGYKIVVTIDSSLLCDMQGLRWIKWVLKTYPLSGISI